MVKSNVIVKKGAFDFDTCDRGAQGISDTVLFFDDIIALNP